MPHHAGKKIIRQQAEGIADMGSANQVQKPQRGIWWTGFLSKNIQFALDLTLLVLAFGLAYLLRFDFVLSKEQTFRALTQLPYVILFQFVSLSLVGAHSFIWRYVGMAEIKPFLKASIWSLLPLLTIRIAPLPDALQDLRVPLSIILMDTVLCYGGVLGIRVLRRALYEHYERQRQTQGSHDKKPVLLIGAGRAGVLAAKEILGRGDVALNIKGFVDDDKRKHGLTIQGIKVEGGTDDLPDLVKKWDIHHVIITIADASREEIRRIVTLCEEVPVKVRIIPGLYEILQGQVEISRFRDIQIEDLLGRDAVQLDQAGMRNFLAGKTVMVTGAGGSIGSELVRQAALFEPDKILLIERAEFALFNIDREMRESRPALTIVPLVADVGDEARMRTIFNEYAPQVILHAAAHKHVPIMESNPCEAVKNNVLATRLLGEIAGQYGAETFVLISTDKAVRPTSVMGATKRLAELIVQDLDKRFATHYVAVRFGNVIGSAGSVIPIFQEQIRKGGPVTVTHPEMTRYFMTIPEASQLVLQAGAMGESGEIFILDMGEPVRILDLARDVIILSGLKPSEDIDIVFTGIRPGEKLFEELEISEERMTRTRHPKIFIGKIAGCSDEHIRQLIKKLDAFVQKGDSNSLRDYLGRVLPEANLFFAGEKVDERAADEQRELQRAEAPLPKLSPKSVALPIWEGHTTNG